MISMYSGTIGSGKSYHALEDIVEWLDKGKYVIANFPLTFNEGQIKRGWADRFMYVDDRYFLGVKGIRLLMNISAEMGWDVAEEEGLCLVVIDEATNHFPREDAAKPEQKIWRKYFTQSRKQGYDFTLIVQDDNSINKTIGKCIEYDVKHRKANNIFPFSLLTRFGIILFFYNIYWKQQRIRLKSNSSIFVKRLSKMYQSKKMFANLDEELDKFINEMKDLEDEELPEVVWGNCRPGAVSNSSTGRDPEGVGPGGSGANSEEQQEEQDDKAS